MAANEAEEDVQALAERVLAADDYFEVLGASRDASEKDLVRAYRALALKLHPDKCKLEGAEEAFKKVAEAFACLRDPDSRAYYERHGHERGAGAVGSPFHNVNPHDVFREFFEAMEKAQADRAGGRGRGGAGFNFVSASGGSMGGQGGVHVFTLNGDNLAEVVPSWLKPVVQLLPPQLVALALFALVLAAFASVAGFVVKHFLYFAAIALFVPPPFRGFLLVVTAALGMAGVLG